MCLSYNVWEREKVLSLRTVGTIVQPYTIVPPRPAVMIMFLQWSENGESLSHLTLLPLVSMHACVCVCAKSRVCCYHSWYCVLYILTGVERRQTGMLHTRWTSPFSLLVLGSSWDQPLCNYYCLFLILGVIYVILIILYSIVINLWPSSYCPSTFWEKKVKMKVCEKMRYM